MSRPSREEAEQAIRVLLGWVGDDPNREGLKATPGRVVRAYEEWCSGYKDDPVEYLRRTFSEVDGYDEMVVLRDIEGLTYDEIAKITGFNLGTVKSKLARARSDLRKKLRGVV